MLEYISKKNKKTLFISLLAFFVIIIALFIFSMAEERKNEKKLAKDNSIRVAVCPTFYELLLLKQDNWYNVISARSTAESLKLLDSNMADYVISGRPPKAHESEYEYFYINESGYSFLGASNESFYINDLENKAIYTDLKKEDIEFLKNNLNLNDIIIVEDVNNRPEGTLAITNWQNTDYSRDSIVHVYNKKNERYKFSRTPILYCKNCDKDIVNLFIKTLNN